MEFLFENLQAIQLVVSCLIGGFSLFMMIIWGGNTMPNLTVKTLMFITAVTSVPIIIENASPDSYDITYGLMYFVLMAILFFFISAIWEKTTALNKFIKLYTFVCSIGAAVIILTKSLQ